MNDKEPIKLSKINFNNIVYTSIKENNKKKIIYLKYKDKDKISNFVFQTPTLLNINDAIIKNNYSEIDIPIECKKKNKEKGFIDFLNNLDKKILYDASNNSSSWFKNIDNDNILYQKIIRSSNDNSYENGIINLKIISTNIFKTVLRNEKKIIKINEIPKNSWVKMILECYAIIISENGFSLFIRPIIIYFKKIKNNNYNYKFIKDSDDSDNDNDDDNEIEELESNNIFIKPGEIKNSSSEYSTTSSNED
tara:strand:- start:2300 stop:3049 length:750 start_codon:yes stop_codon:yes gene_type:complete